MYQPMAIPDHLRYVQPCNRMRYDHVLPRYYTPPRQRAEPVAEPTPSAAVPSNPRFAHVSPRYMLPKEHDGPVQPMTSPTTLRSSTVSRSPYQHVAPRVYDIPLRTNSPSRASRAASPGFRVGPAPATPRDIEKRERLLMSHHQEYVVHSPVKDLIQGNTTLGAARAEERSVHKWIPGGGRGGGTVDQRTSSPIKLSLHREELRVQRLRERASRKTLGADELPRVAILAREMYALQEDGHAEGGSPTTQPRMH
jgi:hypothetical protein